LLTTNLGKLCLWISKEGTIDLNRFAQVEEELPEAGVVATLMDCLVIPDYLHEDASAIKWLA